MYRKNGLAQVLSKFKPPYRGVSAAGVIRSPYLGEIDVSLTDALRSPYLGELMLALLVPYVALT